jgi:hypothetical protein
MISVTEMRRETVVVQTAIPLFRSVFCFLNDGSPSGASVAPGKVDPSSVACGPEAEAVEEVKGFWVVA